MKVYSLKCVDCGVERVFSRYSSYYQSKNGSGRCRKCTFSNPDRNKKISDSRIGDKNHFFGKKHTDDSKRKISISSVETFKKVHSSESKTKFRNFSDKNGMYGKSCYDVWVSKYGKEEADKRLFEMKNKLSQRFKGSNNPMYGKPAPKGSGGGISGWYKGFYFRSLMEFSFIYNTLLSGSKILSAENSNFIISYIDEFNSPRTYRPDFIVDDKILVEVKPKRLQNSKNNILKFNSAEQYCSAMGLVFLVVDVPIVDREIIQQLVSNGEIILLEKGK